MQRSDLILKDPKILKGMIILSFPILISNVLKALHDIVDTYFLNKIENSAEAIGAIATSWPILATFLAIAVGLSVAAISLISQYAGANRIKEASLYASKLFGIAVVFGVILNILVFVSSPLIMQLMGARGVVHAYGVDYLSIRSFEMVFLFVFSVFTSMRQALGDTTTPVVLSVFSLILNIILTPIFIFHFNLEVMGAALSTLIANLATLPLVLYFMFRKNFIIHVTIKDIGYDSKIFKHILKVGIPATAGSTLSSLGFVVLQAMILSFGVTTAAAFSVGNRVSAFFLMPGMSLGSVLTSYVGQNIGAGNGERAKKAYQISRNATVVIMSILGLIAFPFVGSFAALLSSGETLELAKDYLVFLLIMQPFMAIFSSYCGVFDGSGNTRLSFFMQTTRLWVFRIPVILILRELTQLGSSAIWICMLFSNILICIVGYFLMKHVDFRKNILQQEAANETNT